MFRILSHSFLEHRQFINRKKKRKKNRRKKINSCDFSYDKRNRDEERTLVDTICCDRFLTFVLLNVNHMYFFFVLSNININMSFYNNLINYMQIYINKNSMLNTRIHFSGYTPLFPNTNCRLIKTKNLSHKKGTICCSKIMVNVCPNPKNCQHLNKKIQCKDMYGI